MKSTNKIISIGLLSTFAVLGLLVVIGSVPSVSAFGGHGGFGRGSSFNSGFGGGHGSSLNSGFGGFGHRGSFNRGFGGFGFPFFMGMGLGGFGGFGFGLMRMLFIPMILFFVLRMISARR